MAHKMSAEMQACIKECLECHRICVETVAHCLALGGRHAAPEHVTALLDCADICGTSADFMLRESRHHGSTCGVCAAVCDACARSCGEMAQSDDLMRRCAEVCHRCADSCRQMAGAGARS